MVWLVSQGRIKDAELILEKAAKFNNKTLPPNSLSSTYECEESRPMLENGGHGNMEMEDKVGNEENHVSTPTSPTSVTSKLSMGKRRTYTIIDLFKTPHMRKITFCIAGLWYVLHKYSMKSYLG